jgi:DNA-directed RNA polymerase II subunit RPB1
VEHITRVFMRQLKSEVVDRETGAVKMESEWVLDTEGVNMMDVMCADKKIDDTRVVSNDIVETIKVLGVEAVRQGLLGELRAVIEFDGSYVNYRHLSCLCDVMTCRGHLLAITRHGINRIDSGALMRCSFEETVEVSSRPPLLTALFSCSPFYATSHILTLTAPHNRATRIAPLARS